MKALDTNVLVRFMTGDDIIQSQKVYILFKNAETEKTQMYVPAVVLLELIWVLESAYEIPGKEIADALGNLLLLPILKFEHEASVRKFVHEAKTSNADLADLLIAHTSIECGCDKVLTFDKKASRLEYFELVK